MADYHFIGGDGKSYGPYTAEQMREFMAQNRLAPTSQVRVDDGPLQPASSFPEIASGHPVPGPAVPNYLVHSILVTLCCCMPFGIVAIVFAAKVDGLVQSGQHAAAVQASKKAKMWCWIGFGVGIPATILVVALQVAAETI